MLLKYEKLPKRQVNEHEHQKREKYSLWKISAVETNKLVEISIVIQTMASYVKYNNGRRVIQKP